MQTSPLTTFIQNFRWTVVASEEAGKSDGKLLESFIACNDDAAFGALVKRHGPMVLGVCRRVLRNCHDAEDAFQATFCVLVRKAASVKPRERVGSWLHGVAYRTALKARALAAKRQAREKRMIDVPEPQAVPQTSCDDLKSLLDQELGHLPEKYRLPIVLCDLEGKSIKAATLQLAWPQGTLAGRLARARTLLARRLTQRGVALTGGSLALVLAETAWSAGVPVALVVSIVKNAAMVAAGQGALSGVVSAQVAALTKGVLKNMLLTKLQAAVAVFTVIAVVGGGSVRWLQEAFAASQAQIVNHKLDEGGPRSNGIVTPPAQPATAQQALRVSAWVNGKAIYEHEVLTEAGPAIRKAYEGRLPAQRVVEPKDGFQKTLDELIDKELLLQDAVRMLEQNPKFLEKLKSIGSKEAQKLIVAEMRKMNVATVHDYEQVLLAQGTTLENVRHNLERDVIASENLRAKIRSQIEKQVTPETIRSYYEEHFDERTPLDEATQELIAKELRSVFADQGRRQLLKQLHERAVIVIPKAQTP